MLTTRIILLLWIGSRAGLHGQLRGGEELRRRRLRPGKLLVSRIALSLSLCAVLAAARLFILGGLAALEHHVLDLAHAREDDVGGLQVHVPPRRGHVVTE